MSKFAIRSLVALSEIQYSLQKSILFKDTDSYYLRCLLQGYTFATAGGLIAQKRWYPRIRFKKEKSLVTQKLPVWILNLRFRFHIHESSSNNCACS